MKYVFMGFIFWIAENMYFGWNLKPENGYELACDYIVSFLICCGLWKNTLIYIAEIKQLRKDVDKLKGKE